MNDGFQRLGCVGREDLSSEDRVSALRDEKSPEMDGDDYTV